MSFDKSISILLRLEGGEVNDAADRGGHTNFGITEAVARRHGYKGSMSELPLSLSKQIYKRDYWDVNRLDQVALIDEHIADEVFEAGVNCGPRTAAMWLQRAINCANIDRRSRTLLTAEITVDGIIGPKTLASLKAVCNVDARLVYNVQNLLQGAQYVQLAQGDFSQRLFLRGWINHRVNLNPEPFL